MIKRTLQIILLISVVLLVASYFLKDQLPEKSEIDEKLYQEPKQEETDVMPFEKKVDGITYTIKPLYSYELYGLVVSYHHSSNWWDYYHKEWNDFINLKDICVVWGDNIDSEVYKHMKFKSGSWTCYAEFKYGTDQGIWSKFANNKLSNNHLLSSNGEASKKIIEAETGDQIHFRGYLAEYSHSDEQFKRSSSISRDDRGNHSCETVYVTDFEIVNKKEDIYREIFNYSKYPLIGSLILLILNMFRSPLSRKKNGKNKSKAS